MNNYESINDNEDSFVDFAFQVGDLVRVDRDVYVAFKFPVLHKEEREEVGVITSVELDAFPHLGATSFKVHFMDGSEDFHIEKSIDLIARGS
jgi:hypothetical protein